MLNIRQRPFARYGISVGEDENIGILAEQPIDIFKGAVCGFRIEEIDNWDEGSVAKGPNDIELPVQRLDAYWGDLDNCRNQSAWGRK